MCGSEAARYNYKGDLNRETIGATTLFISDLPDDMDEIWFKNIFSGAGKIIEAIIPRKRSFRLNKKFGFVKYGSKSEGLKAIKMWNTAQIQGHQLVVKFARFGNSWWTQGRKSEQGRKPLSREVYREVKRKNADISGDQYNSNVGISGNSREHTRINTTIPDPEINKGEKEKHCISVSEVGNGWLYRSAIAKLSPLRSMIYMQDHLRNLGFEDIKIRPIDSNQVVLTFSSIQDRDSIFNDGKMSWLKGYFSEIQKWDDTICSQRSRLVWLNCYGIPLHVWNGSTFNKIGQTWGEVISISEESFNCLSFAVGKVLISTSHMDTINQVITLVNNDRRFNIRVTKEQYVINTFLRSECKCKGCFFSEIQGGQDLVLEKGKVAELERLARMSQGKEVEEANGESAPLMTAAALKGKKMVVADNVASSSSGTETSLGGNGMDNQGVEECVAQVSLVANSVTENGCSLQPCDEQENHAEEDLLQRPIKSVVNNAKGKKKRKTIEDILGFSKLNSKGRKNNKKSVVVRSAVTAAAMSASLSSDGILNRNRLILNEAQAI